MSEAKEAIIREDESESDDTDEPYQSVYRNRGNLSFCTISCEKTNRFPKNMLSDLRRGFVSINLTVLLSPKELYYHDANQNPFSAGNKSRNEEARAGSLDFFPR